MKFEQYQPLSTGYAQYVVRSIGICCKTSPGTYSSSLMRAMASSGHFDTGENGRSSGLVASTIMPDVLISSHNEGSKKSPRNNGCRILTCLCGCTRVAIAQRISVGLNTSISSSNTNTFLVWSNVRAAAAARPGSPSDILFMEMNTL